MITTRLPKGQVKIESIANLDQINTLFEQRHFLKYVYETLVNEGKITMKYAALQAFAEGAASSRNCA